ncbi:Smr/MutS family protein [Mycoplasmopsis bovis]|uniref:Smr/MutS family protein n=1 Tax=Mycoplasmopsis bovis TaxID=28903 RepID=UPI000A6468BA|nr:Smr/MutS family protein [Mycoplasmopsis bovis]
MSKKSRNNTIQYDNNDYSNIVDLHGFTIAEALTQVQLSLANAYESDFYYDYVTIITGKGQGAILANIEEYLRDAIMTMTFQLMVHQ